MSKINRTSLTNKLTLINQFSSSYITLTIIPHQWRWKLYKSGGRLYEIFKTHLHEIYNPMVSENWGGGAPASILPSILPPMLQTHICNSKQSLANLFFRLRLLGILHTDTRTWTSHCHDVSQQLQFSSRRHNNYPLYYNNKLLND